jgi:protein Mpv17
MGIWSAYNSLLASRPILTKALTSLTGFTLGDVLAQKFVEKDKAYDFARTARLASFGFLVHGPTGHFFYGFLDKMIPGTAARTVATKVAIDQLAWNPCFGIMFFTYLGLAEGKSFGEIGQKINDSLATAVTGSWVVWIPAHTINFRFIPTEQRLLYINSIQIGYNVFLSVIGNRSNKKEE